MSNSNETIQDEFFSEISEADILSEIAEIKSEGWTEEQLLRLCAVLTCENEGLTKACLVHEGSFSMLYEKYQISEQNWQVQWKSRNEVFLKEKLALITDFEHRIKTHHKQQSDIIRDTKNEFAQTFNDEHIKKVAGSFLKKRGKEITVGAFIAGGKTRLTNVGRKAGIASGKSRNNQEAIHFIQSEWACEASIFLANAILPTHTCQRLKRNTTIEQVAL